MGGGGALKAPAAWDPLACSFPRVAPFPLWGLRVLHPLPSPALVYGELSGGGTHLLSHVDWLESLHRQLLHGASFGSLWSGLDHRPLGR